MQYFFFDCDPGHDDVLGLLLALASPEVEIRGIVTSAGNQTSEKTLHNTLRLLSMVERTEIPVIKGLSAPIRRKLTVAADVHGETGLDGADLGEIHMKPEQGNPIDFMLRHIMSAPEPVTAFITGPMTNTAVLLLSHPEVKPHIKQISFMGGACFGGNKTPLAEFNIYVDPEAADVVFASGIPLVMCGLDVTLKAQIFHDEIDNIRNLGNRTGAVIADLLDFFARTTTPNFLHPERLEGAHMHDPCAVAAVLEPERFVFKEMYGYVSCTDDAARGCTVLDYDGISGKPANVRVAFGLDREWFIDRLTRSIEVMP